MKKIWGARLALTALAATTLSGCGAMDTIQPVAGSVSGTLANLVSFGPGTAATPEQIAAGGPKETREIDCPTVEVQDGTSALRVGGPTNESVRYQFDITDTARECQIQGSQFAIKVGVAGRLLIGCPDHDLVQAQRYVLSLPAHRQARDTGILRQWRRRPAGRGA